MSGGRDSHVNVPAALCWTFGDMVGDRRQGWALLAAMVVSMLGTPFVIEHQTVHATALIGISVYPVDATGVEVLRLLPLCDVVLTDYSAVAFEVRRRITDKRGQRFNEIENPGVRESANAGTSLIRSWPSRASTTARESAPASDGRRTGSPAPGRQDRFAACARRHMGRAARGAYRGDPMGVVRSLRGRRPAEPPEIGERHPSIAAK